MDNLLALLEGFSFFKEVKKNTKECEVWVRDTNPDFIICIQRKKKQYNKVPFNIGKSLILKDSDYIKISETKSVKEAFSLRFSIDNERNEMFGFLPREASKLIESRPIFYGVFAKAGYSMYGVIDDLELMFVKKFAKNFTEYFEMFKGVEFTSPIKMRLLKYNFNLPKILFLVDTKEKNEFFSSIIKLSYWRDMDYMTNEMFEILEGKSDTSKFFFKKFWRDVTTRFLESDNDETGIEAFEDIVRNLHPSIKRENVGLSILHAFLLKKAKVKLSSEMVYLLYDATDEKDFFIKTLVEITGIEDVGELLKTRENIFLPQSENF